MKPNSKKPETPVKSEIDKAKEIIAAAEKEKETEALSLVKKLSDDLEKLGFAIAVSGQFQGNQIRTSIVLVPKK